MKVSLRRYIEKMMEKGDNNRSFSNSANLDIYEDEDAVAVTFFDLSEVDPGSKNITRQQCIELLEFIISSNGTEWSIAYGSNTNEVIVEYANPVFI